MLKSILGRYAYQRKYNHAHSSANGQFIGADGGGTSEEKPETQFEKAPGNKMEYMRSIYDPWAQSLTKEQTNALNWYSSSHGYVVANHLLRNDFINHPEAAKYAKDVRLAEEALHKVKTPEDFEVKRGLVDNEKTKALWETFQQSVGKDFQDKGFVSTTVGARDFGKKNGVVIDITIPKGSPGGYLEAKAHDDHLGMSVSPYGYDPITAHPTENEFLLPPGMTFTVKSAQVVDGIRTVKLEMNPVSQKKSKELSVLPSNKSTDKFLWNAEDIVWAKG